MSAPSTALNDRFLRRIRHELRHFKSSPEEILSLTPLDENTGLEQWKAMIKGPVGTPYENGVFVLDIHLIGTSDRNNRFYPFIPPKIKFKTKVFHPNISSKGEICLDILHSCYSPSLSLEKILLCICSLLSAPNIDDFLVPEAAFLYKENREEYNKKATEWTRKYAMAGGVTTEAQENLNETGLKLSDLANAVTRMNMSASSSSNQFLEQKAIRIQPSRRRRPVRFNAVEPSQAKTFDNGESKECVPIIAQCLWAKDNREETYKHQMNEFYDGVEKLDIDNELQSLITALEREGIKLGKQPEFEILINELRTLIDSTPDKVGQGCIRLYSMETFLYPQLNQFLREADHTKVKTYGSFVRLVYFYFNHPSSIEVHSIEVYRGMNLSSSIIDTYKEATKNSISYRWAGFSSTSKSREFAEDFNTNTLFIMQLKKIYSREKKAIDISVYSQFPEEEEILLKAGVEFTVVKVQYDNEKKKYYIYLNVYV